MGIRTCSTGSFLTKTNNTLKGKELIMKPIISIMLIVAALTCAAGTTTVGQSIKQEKSKDAKADGTDRFELPKQLAAYELLGLKVPAGQTIIGQSVMVAGITSNVGKTSAGKPQVAMLDGKVLCEFEDDSTTKALKEAIADVKKAKLDGFTKLVVRGTITGCGSANATLKDCKVVFWYTVAATQPGTRTGELILKGEAQTSSWLSARPDNGVAGCWSTELKACFGGTEDGYESPDPSSTGDNLTGEFKAACVSPDGWCLKGDKKVIKLGNDPMAYLSELDAIEHFVQHAQATTLNVTVSAEPDGKGNYKNGTITGWSVVVDEKCRDKNMDYTRKNVVVVYAMPQLRNSSRYERSHPRRENSGYYNRSSNNDNNNNNKR